MQYSFTHNIREKLNNRGLTLVELIAVISIIAVLSGVVAPQFVKYIESNRTKACVQNRDAILNVYSKGVYAMSRDYNLDKDSSVQDLIDAGDTDEYSRQAMLYTSCPGGGTYAGYVSNDNTKAYITCSEHGDVCIVDFTGWTGEGWEATDGDYAVPSKDVEPFPTIITPGPTSTPTSPVSNGDSGVWPYPLTVDGKVDSRWTANGTSPTDGSVIYIPVPLCGYFTARSGADYILTESLGVQNVNGQPCVKLEYEKAKSPESLMVTDNGFIVRTSGLHYSVTLEGNEIKNTDDLPPIGQYVNATSKDNAFYFSYGDMVTVKYGNQYKTFVALDRSNQFAKIPDMTQDNVKNKDFGSLSSTWAVVPESKCVGYSYNPETGVYTVTTRKLTYAVDDGGKIKVTYGDPITTTLRLN